MEHFKQQFGDWPQNGKVGNTSHWIPLNQILISVTKFLANHTATQYDRLLAAACCPSVCLSVCL